MVIQPTSRLLRASEVRSTHPTHLDTTVLPAHTPKHSVTPAFPSTLHAHNLFHSPPAIKPMLRAHLSAPLVPANRSELESRLSRRCFSNNDETLTKGAYFFELSIPLLAVNLTQKIR